MKHIHKYFKNKSFDLGATIVFVVVFVLVLPILSGCTSQQKAYVGAAAVHAADAADSHLDYTLWQLCNGQSIGAIRRAFGGSPDMAKHYSGLCAGAETRVEVIR